MPFNCWELRLSKRLFGMLLSILQMPMLSESTVWRMQSATTKAMNFPSVLFFEVVPFCFFFFFVMFSFPKVFAFIAFSCDFSSFQKQKQKKQNQQNIQPISWRMQFSSNWAHIRLKYYIKLQSQFHNGFSSIEIVRFIYWSRPTSRFISFHFICCCWQSLAALPF